VLFEGDMGRMGAAVATPDNSSFRDTGPAQNYCFMFLRTAAEIQHEHEAAFVANPNVVTFSDAG